MLSNELDQYRNGVIYEKEVDSVVTNGKKTKEAVKQLINSYRGKASTECISYFESDFKYFMAVAKLYFDEDQQSAFWIDMQNHKLPKTTKKLPKVEYPEDFFLELDTMPILMNKFEWNSSYQSFIQKAKQFKQNRLGWAAGKRYFKEDYYFNQAALVGFPLYSQIAHSIDSELRKGQTEFNIVSPYFEAFINNCTDQALTEPLKKFYETAKQLQIGNQFPFNSFVLQDSSVFNLNKYKGKPICLILLGNTEFSINSYKTEIDKFTTDEVEFIIARVPAHFKTNAKYKPSILEKSNVTYIELAEQKLESKLLLNGTRIFMIDKWYRIDENNAEDPMNHVYTGSMSKFEKSLRKTIETKRYSKAEKTAMIKTIGWSFGSILFTFLIGLWIYRIRIRRLKAQEAAKRRIQELEIKAIRSQMNPHFIFNSLNSIQSLINGNQFKEANIYLSKFAVLLRGVLNNSEKSRISLSDELQAVELYCQLEQLRFEFKFEIIIDLEVNTDLIEIPGMIIQPLAENAVVHGLSGKGDQGKLTVQVKRQNGNLCVCVSDNGVGLQTQKINELSQKGFGLKLVEERINILNLDGKAAKLNVENQRNTSGTIATLIIPID
jgi:two-component sensor histidine kinase